MKPPRAVLALLAVFALGGVATRAAADDFAAVRAADAARIAATITGDADRLGELLAADLRYAHSDGRVQTKSQLLAAVASNPVKYLSVVPHDVELQAIAPGAVTMTGRAEVVAQTKTDRVKFALRFLAVWRDESGRWRLAAYQSSQLLPSASPASAAP